MVMVVVFDSSPWIFLTKLGLLEKTLVFFDKVLIPVSVHDEVIKRRDEVAGMLEQLKASNRIEVVGARSSRLAQALGRRLGKGEAEAITVALEREIDIVLLDDHLARLEASRLGLKVKGTLGIIRRLMELGKYTCDLEALYRQLIAVGFRVKEDLFWEIFGEI